MARYTKENQYQREQSQVDVLYFINVDHSNSYRIWNRANTFVPSEGVALSGCKREENLTAEFRYQASEAGTQEEGRWVDVPFTYYPNYRAYGEDGTELDVAVGDQGVVRVELPEKTEGTVKIEYKEPWFYLAGRLISIIFLLAFVSGIFWKKQKA